MVYLRNSLGRSHFKASQLILYNLESKKDQIIVDIVKNPKGGFPGIYCQRIPAQRFTSTIYLNTCWKDLRVKTAAAKSKVFELIIFSLCSGSM